VRTRRIVAVTWVALLLAACARTHDPYAPYRQTRVETVPGTLEWQLRPVDDFTPAIAPEAAFAKIFQAGRRPDVLVVLARVGTTTTDSVWPPAWIFVSPDMCFATEKGDLVSPGRSGNGCEDENLYVQGVDASTGEPLGGFSAFDTPDGWVPARAGTPEVVVARTQEGTTRLH
jgi:hypothetical protein